MQLIDGLGSEPTGELASAATILGEDVDRRSPLDAEAFARCMRALTPFEHQPRLAVAVSGGPDSLALTLLASAWARSLGGHVISLTVDHGLRSGSTEEAEQTGRWLKTYGIKHHILTWQGQKPTTGLQHHAREARYDLLAGWCRKAGVFHLLTAHHRQDQAETVALRKARQSGDSGLAAMASIRDLPGFRLLRPLLGIDKERLTATLAAIGQPSLEDPSNRNPRFTRNRLRAGRLNVDTLTGEARIFGEKRRLAELELSALLARLVIIDPAGFAYLQAPAFTALSPALAQSVLARLLTTIGGNPYPPRSKHLHHLVNHMRSGRPFRGRTLGRCCIIETKSRWLICREALPAPPLPLSPGRWVRFEDRFTLRLRDRRPGLEMRILGQDGLALARNCLKTKTNRRLPGAVKAALPSIWREGALLAVPHLGRFETDFNASKLDLHFRPRTPLANAAFIAHMVPHVAQETVALRCC